MVNEKFIMYAGIGAILGYILYAYVDFVVNLAIVPIFALIGGLIPYIR